MNQQAMPHGLLELSEVFDCQIIWNLGTHPLTKKDVDVWAIGSKPEPTVGFLGFRLTPYFFSKNSLGRYCRSKKGKEEINERAAEIFPDWDKHHCCFNADQSSNPNTDS